MNHKLPNKKTQCKSFKAHKSACNQSDITDFLDSPGASAILKTDKTKQRERLYSPSATLQAFIAQVLDADRSCQAMVNRIGIQRIAEKKSQISAKTGAYCTARKRLSATLVAELMRHSGNALAAMGSVHWRWRGHTLKLIDGTTLSMPDTPENQKEFPQSASQKNGLGFPLARLVGITDLSTGAIIDVAIGAFKGKRASEHELLREMLDNFSNGDIVIADRYYCSYWLVAALKMRGAHMLVQQNATRKVDFRKGKKLGARDHIVEWKRPKKPDWMSDQDYGSVPEFLSMRELKVDRKVMVTTLLCPTSAPRNELNICYQKRWNIELSLRDIKTTMGMDVLRCKSPDMIKKEIHIYMLSYNLVRIFMIKAARHLDKKPENFSFKHCLQCWREVQRWPLDFTNNGHALMDFISQITVGNRPGRVEPRAVKRRPKPYPLLTVPRGKARDKIRRHGHAKK